MSFFTEVKDVDCEEGKHTATKMKNNHEIKAWAVNKVKDIRIETKECKICYGVVYCPECHNKRVIHNFLMTEFEIKENELK